MAFSNARSEKRWKQAVAMKLHRDPVCQIRVRCKGARASLVVPISRTSQVGSHLDPDRLHSACPACYTWKTAGPGLRVHP